MTSASGGVTQPTLGVLSGLGPLAGAHFYERFVRLTEARGDEDHFRSVLISDPAIPSRRQHLLHGGVSPLPQLTGIARELERAGATLLVMPSSTSHAYYDALAGSVGVPFMNMLSKVSAEISRQGFRRPGFVATGATIQLGLYEPHLADDVRPVYPDPDCQAMVDRLIDMLKGAGTASGAHLDAVVADVFSRDCWREADCVVLACTEASLLSLGSTGRAPVVSATDVLAAAAVSEMEEQRCRVA